MHNFCHPAGFYPIRSALNLMVYSVCFIYWAFVNLFRFLKILNRFIAMKCHLKENQSLSHLIFLRNCVWNISSPYQFALDIRHWRIGRRSCRTLSRHFHTWAGTVDGFHQQPLHSVYSCFQLGIWGLPWGRLILCCGFWFWGRSIVSSFTWHSDVDTRWGTDAYTCPVLFWKWIKRRMRYINEVNENDEKRRFNSLKP